MEKEEMEMHEDDDSIGDWDWKDDNGVDGAKEWNMRLLYVKIEMTKKETRKS